MVKRCESPDKPTRGVGAGNWCCFPAPCQPTATLGPTSNALRLSKVPPVVLLRSALDPMAVLPLAVLLLSAKAPTAVLSSPVELLTSVAVPSACVVVHRWC